MVPNPELEKSTESELENGAAPATAKADKKEEAQAKSRFSSITDKMPTMESFNNFNKAHPNLVKYGLFAVSAAAVVTATAVAVRKLRK